MRAAVWPILEFDSANGPIHFTLANKGVGPAIIQHVIVKVDGQPVRDWKEALEKIVGPGEHLGSESDIGGHVFAAGESRTVFTPHDAENNPLNFDKSNPLWVKVNKGPFTRDGRDLLLLDTRRMLDLARWRVDTQHYHRDPSLPHSVSD